MRVLVLGGTGFVGRHVAAALAARHHDVVIGSRRRGPRGRAIGEPHPPERRVARFERLTTPEAWAPLLANIDAVVNCVGILRECGSATYERVHLVAPAALAVACGEARIRRLVHVSMLGLRPDLRSRFGLSKLRGEVALAMTGMPCTILRTSLIEGAGGQASRWLQRMARWPVHVLPADARGRFAVVDVRDVAEAVAVLCDRSPPRRLQALDIGGRSTFTLREYLAMLRQLRTGRPARVIELAPRMSSALAFACDALRISPWSRGALELARQDNVPSFNALPRLLNRPSHGLGSALATPSGWDTVRHANWLAG